MSVEQLNLHQVLAQRQQRVVPAWIKKTLHYVILGIITIAFIAFTAKPALGAEQISIFYGPLQFSLSVSALETYVKTGKINNELAFYTKSFKPQDLVVFRQALLYREDVSPFVISQFLYSSNGEMGLRKIGELIQTESGQNGFYAIRAALILAAADPEGLTLLNVMRYYPSNSIRINISLIF
ncbi:MAG: alpha/beta hydrolase [Nostoc sp.]|uniref:alpha/beta hydrolase n=1 Tax=Nostoc sp. TaxID=1180 RepID=UPI002FF38112